MMSMATENSPSAATFSPHWRPCFLPAGGLGAPHPPGVFGWGPRSSPPADALWSGQWFDPLAGGGLREAVAVGAVGDEDVGVVHEPVDCCGRDRFGHQLVEPGGVDG